MRHRATTYERSAMMQFGNSRRVLCLQRCRSFLLERGLTLASGEPAGLCDGLEAAAVVLPCKTRRRCGDEQSGGECHG
jgi:hypothetical protein